jgi:WD40 repeat protein
LDILRTQRGLLHTLNGHEFWIVHAAYSPAGDTLVTASSDGTALVAGV